MKNIVITGATSGIGVVVACKLAARGNRVIALARSAEKGEALKLNYKYQYPKGKGSIEIVLCDLNSLESIVNGCNQIISVTKCVDILINNAGVWNFDYHESEDHIEETLQVNVLAPLLINHLLLDHLQNSTSAKSIFAASALHQGTVDFSNLEFKENFSGFKAYRQSKLEIILLCRLLAMRIKSSRVSFYSEHPGFISTELARDANWFSKFFVKTFGGSPAKGANTLIFLVEKNKNQLISGEYYVNEKVRKLNPNTYDMEGAEELLKKLSMYLKDFSGAPSVLLDARARHLAL